MEGGEARHLDLVLLQVRVTVRPVTVLHLVVSVQAQQSLGGDVDPPAHGVSPSSSAG